MLATGGVLFCGSIQVPGDTQEAKDDAQAVENVLRTAVTALPERLLRISDGEVGLRQNFIMFQASSFLKTPWVCAEPAFLISGLNPDDYPVGDLKDVQLGDTGYDRHAIQSYEVFSKLKQEGVIDPRTRFQVCIPSPLNCVIWLARQEFKDHVEPLYEEQVIKALHNIQEHIPHHELSIQWDIPQDTLLLDGMTHGRTPPFAPWFEVTMDSITERIARIAAAVQPDVDMGFHLCYGDYGHVHYMEPKDAAVLVDFSNHILKAVQRPVNWIHMPVPIDRKDEAFFKPLQNLRLRPETELYLGLVHANDLDGTRERISVAQKVVPGLNFGVATECGLGRTPKSDIASIFDILKAVSTPVLATGGPQ